MNELIEGVPNWITFAVCVVSFVVGLVLRPISRIADWLGKK